MNNENTPTLETERLVLRRFVENDINDIFLIYSDEQVNQFLPWFPFETPEDARVYLKENIFADYQKEVAYRYAVEFKATGQVVGYVSLCSIDLEKACGDLGYGLRKEFWNQGIITEVSEAVLRRLELNGFNFITATHDVNNPKSGKVMEKLGMIYERSYDEMWQPKNFLVTFRLYKINFV